MNYIPKFKETFPELSKVSSEEMCNRFASLGIDFYTEERASVNGWVRFTAPFALIAIVVMFLSIPIVFLFTGNWGWPYSKKNRVFNWFRALKIFS